MNTTTEEDRCTRCNGEPMVQLKDVIESNPGLIVDERSVAGLGDPEDYLCGNCSHDVYLTLRSNACQERVVS